MTTSPRNRAGAAMLTVFPLGLLSTAVIFDALYLATGNPDLATFSFWAIAAGLAPGSLAASFFSQTE